MGAQESPDLHHGLVDDLVEKELIVSSVVEAAFRAVRREFFLPDVPPEEVYMDRHIPTKEDESGRPISSSSQPAVMAIMLEQLDLRAGQHVLEIGAGTGYNAALMAHVVGEEGRVTTVDLEADLTESARAHLAAAGYEQVEVICGDGMVGYAENAPYDRIILTVAGWDIPPEWLAQLKADGRLVMPLSFYGPQLSVAFEREDGLLASRSVRACGFMPIRGPRAEPLRTMEICEGLKVIGMRDSARQPGAADAAEVEAWLRRPAGEAPAEIALSGGELLFKWPLWAALYEPQHVVLDIEEDTAGAGLAPDMLPPLGVNMGLLSASGLALLAPAREADAVEGDNPFARNLGVRVRSYGPDKGVGARLPQQLEAWDNAGRPGSERTAVWALPVDEAPGELAADGCVTRRWHHFCIWWDGDSGREKNPPGASEEE